MVSGERGMTPEQEVALHERWIREIEQAWAPLFESCPDAVYVYIDDEHKTCNQRAADFWGMTIDEFKGIESYLDECVAEESIDLVMHNYFTHFEEEMKPVRFDYLARRHDGSKVPATCFNVPIVHDGHPVLLCFVRAQDFGDMGEI